MRKLLLLSLLAPLLASAQPTRPIWPPFTGTLPTSVLPGLLPALSIGDGSGLTNITAVSTNIDATTLAGIVPTNNLPGLLPGLSTGDGAGLTNTPGGSIVGPITNRPSIRLVVIGDSLSAPSSSWSYWLKQNAANNGITVVTNFAVGGMPLITTNVNGILQQYTNALAFAPTNTGLPTVLSVWGGMNDRDDTADNIWGALSNITVGAVAHGFDVMMFTQTSYSEDTRDIWEKMEDVNRKTRSFNTNYWRLVDTAVLLGNPAINEIYNDGLHFQTGVDIGIARYLEWIMTHGDGYRSTFSPPWENRVFTQSGLATNLTVSGITFVGGVTNFPYPEVWVATNLSYTVLNTNYTIPTWSRNLKIEGISGGGPGGSGRVGAAGSISAGGGGGGGSGYSVVDVDAAVARSVSATLTIAIGHRGQGAATQSTNDSDGLLGVASGTTSVRFTSASSNLVLVVTGGGRGAAGTATGAAGGAAGAGVFAGAAGAAASAIGGAGVTGGTASGPGGGASGAGVNTSDLPFAGAVGGYGPIGLRGTQNFGIAGLINGGNGEGPTASRIILLPDAGAGSGGSATNANGGSGGHGWWGSGGGGGAGARNGFASGPGGDGGPSFVRITAY